MKASSIRVNKHSVLPPIIPETEKKFLESIQSYITSEIEKVGCTDQGPAEEYYIIYKNVFEMIIEHVSAYKSILTTIKQEYDAFIEVLKKGQWNAFHLHGKLKILACEPSTLMYYKKRIIQLEEKVKRIEANSLRIQNLIQKIRTLRETLAAKEAVTTTKKINPAQIIPGLSLKDSLDIDALSNHLAHLQRRVKELREDMLTKYIPLENTANIEGDLKRALQLRNMAEKKNEHLKFCFYRLTQFVNIVSLWENSDRSIETLQQLISQMIENEKLAKGKKTKNQPSTTKFNELFSRSQYEAAAIYAANCPRGILRNEETMEKFRGMENLGYSLYPLRLASVLKIMLELSEAAGDAIYNYAEVDKHNRSQCFALAQIAYSDCGMHKKAVLCLCKQGQIFGAMDYLHQFHRLPTGWNGKPALMSLGETILSLIHTEHKVYCIRLLEEIAKEGKNVLAQMIENDTVCTVEEWKEIAETCLRSRREKLFQLIVSVLASQEGVVEIPVDDQEDAKLMDHVFL
ncbi:hypothetical protein JD844_025646 [Phrynosoma platyrhinos]|uniref:Clathrin heavy chain linker domain-containing protein 1 n=1 Tax=Phrynosoma platyrhinos TaxID=52577 RepID=A0ABQ7T013_PHRPL|nr:hypothetical protein JD844_025646 [Phrynosoma platyrhinos]